MTRAGFTHKSRPQNKEAGPCQSQRPMSTVREIGRLLPCCPTDPHLPHRTLMPTPVRQPRTWQGSGTCCSCPLRTSA